MSSCFNPLPSQKQGETGKSDSQATRSASFNPLPSQKQGETLPSVFLQGSWLVSIRSPHKSKGRLSCYVRSAIGGLFQSAPLTKARGDAHRRERAQQKQRFNPLPSQKQGETRSIKPSAGSYICFNPLPSQKQGETDESVSPREASCWFQSAPLTKARGDLVGYCSEDLFAGFNPLPSQKQGETWPTCTQYSCPAPVSIRSPHKSKGRRASDIYPQNPVLVSIRSPHKSKGRPEESYPKNMPSPVSIRSPHKSKGRRRQVAIFCVRGIPVSIRSPHKSKGRPWLL